MPVFEAMDHETPEEDLTVLAELSRQASKSWASTHDMYDDAALRRWPCECVEIGSWAGGTALVLAETFDRVYCVDHWQGNRGDRLGQIARDLGPEAVFQTFCRNMGDRLFSTVFPCRGYSLSYAIAWPRKVAMIFIDGSHEYQDVSTDISAWRHSVIPGGILCGHDYGTFEGVTRAVNELVPRSELQTGGRCMWWTTAR